MGRFGLSDIDSPHRLGLLSPQMQAKPMDEIDKSLRTLYLNDAQKLILGLGSRHIYTTGARGLGKTSIMAARLLQVAQRIPRSVNIMAGPSQRTLQAKVGPAVVKTLEQQYGIIEGVHFFRGQPPYHKLKNWPKPLQMPRIWENVIAFYTGSATILVSTSQTAAGNGYNICHLFADEARFLDWDILLGDIYPSLRGDTYTSAGWNRETNPLYTGSTFFSDMGVTLKQRRYTDEANKLMERPGVQEVNNQILDMLADLQLCPDLAKVKAFEDKINKLRCKSAIHFNFNSLHNLELLSEDYIRNQMLNLAPMIFQVQILGIPLKDLGSSGYYSYNEVVHGYMPNGDAQTEIIASKMMKKNHMVNYDVRYEWESPDFDATTEHADDCVLDDDLRPDLPLRIAFDVGHDFCGMVIGQVDERQEKRTLKVIKAMYVKNGKRLESLLRDFNQYYRYQRMANKELIFYTDATMRQGSAYALEKAEEYRFENVVLNTLTKMGWKVHRIDLSRPMMHNVKYQYLGEVFSETAKLHVRINLEQCDFLCLAIEQCEAETTSKGIRKRKSQEKLRSEEGQGGLRETRTDITDALDTLIIGCGRYNLNGQSTAGGVLTNIRLKGIQSR